MDKLANRTLVAYLVDGDEEYRAVLVRGSRLDRELRSVISLPTADRLTGAAREVAARAGDREYDAIRIEVWASAFSGDTAEVRRLPLREHLVSREALAR